MKQLHFDYKMQIAYSEEVSKCNFTIKCIPQSNKRQQVLTSTIMIQPQTTYAWGKDGLGNTQIYGLNGEPHDSFCYQIQGEVIAGNCEYDEEENTSKDMIYRHEHGLNCAGEEIKSYFNSIKKDLKSDVYQKSVQIMESLHRDFVYEPNQTSIETTAEMAFELGKGVCQDYAHIFIALLHLAGISARYVTGLIVGEGASHAWVEILYQGKWYGLDPTNNIPVTDEHIKIGIGRDAKDCMLNRGIMHGGGLHTQTISVYVEEQEKGNKS